MRVKVNKDGNLIFPISNMRFDKKILSMFLKQRKEYSFFRRFKYGNPNRLYGILFDYLVWKENKILKENYLSN